MGNKITLMDAYMIETLRSNGISDNELLTQLELKDLSFLEKLNSNFDFNELFKLYEQDPYRFKSILTDGYTVKFITMKGLQNLLKMKFDKINERDYQLVDNGISNLTIEEAAYPALKQMLSQNWVIQDLSGQDSDSSLANRRISILLV